MSRIPASVAIIAYNEELRIPECLNSVREFDDIVVLVDSRTKDKTAQVASDFGCRVFTEDWKGFGPLKQSAVDKCSNDFVLILDADERLSPESVGIIREALEGSSGVVAYSLKRKNHIRNRWIRHGGWWPDRVVRLFDRRKCAVIGVVHESVVARGNTKRLDAIIEHYGCQGYSDIIKKMNRYSSIAASALYEQNKRVSCISPITHALWRFFKCFVIHRGFMDGRDGLVISVLNAGGAFFKYAKLLEMQKIKK